jgi:hypothetical protein
MTELEQVVSTRALWIHTAPTPTSHHSRTSRGGRVLSTRTCTALARPTQTSRLPMTAQTTTTTPLPCRRSQHHYELPSIERLTCSTRCQAEGRRGGRHRTRTTQAASLGTTSCSCLPTTPRVRIPVSSHERCCLGRRKTNRKRNTFTVRRTRLHVFGCDMEIWCRVVTITPSPRTLPLNASHC